MPGLIYRLYDENNKSHFLSCCWTKRGEEEILVYSAIDDEIVYISKITDAMLTEIDRIQLPELYYISHINGSSSENLIICTSLIGKILLLDSTNKTTKIEITIPPTLVFPAFLTSNSQIIVHPSEKSGKISFFNIENKKEILCLGAESKPLSCACSTDDSNSVACANVEGLIEVYDSRTSKMSFVLEGHTMPIRSLCFSPDSNYLISASQDSLIKVYDPRNGTLISTLVGHNSWVTSLSFSPNNNDSFVSSSLDGTLKLWDLQKLTCLETFSNHNKGIWKVAHNLNGNYFSSVGKGGDICLYIS